MSPPRSSSIELVAAPPRLKSRSSWLVLGGMALCLILLPLSRFLWDSWSQSLFFGLALAISALQVRNFGRPRILSSLSMPLLGFWAIAALSAVRSPWGEPARSFLWTVSTALLLHLLARGTDARDKVLLLRVLCVTAAVYAAFYWRLDYWILAASRRLDRLDATTEFFLNSNVVAAYLNLGFFAALSLWDASPRTARAAALVILVAHGHTRSVAGWIAAILGLAAASSVPPLSRWTFIPGTLRRHPPVFFTRDPRAVWIAASAAAFSIFGLAGWMRGAETLSAFRDRWDWWRTGMAILFSHPFLGAGIGGYERLLPFHASVPMRSLYAHSFWIQAGAELGIVGLAFAAAFLVREIGSAEDKALAGGAVAVLLHSLVDFPMNVPGLLILTFWILGMCRPRIPATDPAGPKAGSALAFVAVPFLIWAAWKGCVRPLMAFQDRWAAQAEFQSGNLKSAEDRLRKAVGRDPIPAQPYSDLAEVLYLESIRNPGRREILAEARRLQKEAIRRDPLNMDFVRREEVLIAAFKAEEP